MDRRDIDVMPKRYIDNDIVQKRYIVDNDVMPKRYFVNNDGNLIMVRDYDIVDNDDDVMPKRYIIKNDGSYKFDYTYERNLVKCYFAIKYGLKEIIMNQKLEDNELTYIEVAAFYGHLDIVIYLHDYGCPWEKKCCHHASRNGHLEVLKYLHENGCPWDQLCYEFASTNGHLEVLKYLYQNGCQKGPSDSE